MQKISKKLYASFHLKSFLLLSQSYNNTKIIFCQVFIMKMLNKLKSEQETEAVKLRN